jgi:hypothetical protein
MVRIEFAVVLLLCFALAPLAQTQPPPPQPVPPPDDVQIVKTVPLKVSPASSVKFRQDLSLPFPSLNTLGARIDAARRAGDPVSLANAANELHGAEMVSGKTAGLTSRQVMNEAADLAALRRQEAELKNVLHVSQQVTLEQEKVAELKRLLAINQQAQRNFDRTEEPVEPRKVIVNNHTTQYIDVQVNGYLRGQVAPGMTRQIVIEEPWNPIVLKGWGDADETIFGPVVLEGRFRAYTWNINADDAIPNKIP